MQLTTELLVPFVDGQIEVVNANGDVFRGEIKTAKVDVVGELVIEFNWLARGIGFPVPARWLVDRQKTCGFTLQVCEVSNIGPGPEGGGDRIQILCMYVDIEVTMFPADGSKLDPAKVEGLVLPV